jgi:hypothetical protein
MTDQLVRIDRNAPVVSLTEPTTSGYVVAAARIDRRPVPLPNSRRKQAALRELRAAAGQLRGVDGVIDVCLFEATFVPPGGHNRTASHETRFDVVLLVETTGPDLVGDVRASAAWGRVQSVLEREGDPVLMLDASNIKRMGPVPHDRGGVFLFNWFLSDDRDRTVAAWHDTAGWFERHTGLDNSTVLLPMSADAPIAIVNHCRWDRYRDVVPALAFDPSFRRFVLKTFEVNGVVPRPVLYRLVR